MKSGIKILTKKSLIKISTQKIKPYCFKFDFDSNEKFAKKKIKQQKTISCSM